VVQILIKTSSVFGMLRHFLLFFPLVVVNHVGALEQAGIAVGSGFVVFPAVTYGIKDDSNAYSQPDSTKESATVTSISPEVVMTLDTGQGEYELMYVLEQGAYSTNANDNYTDQTLTAGGVVSLSRRSTATVEGSYVLGHDARGAGVDEGVVAVEDVFYPDKHRTASIGGSIELGAENSLLGFSTFGRFTDKNYINNFDRGTADREYFSWLAGVGTSIYLSPDADIVVEGRATRVDYISSSGDAQSKEASGHSLLGGFSWSFSGKSTGRAVVGATQRVPDDTNQSAQTSLSWEVEAEWSPKAHSTFALTTSRAFAETSGPGSFSNASSTVISWDHAYSIFFASSIQAIYSRQLFYLNDKVVRTDNSYTLSPSLIYSPSRAMDISVGVSYLTKQSTNDDLEFDRMIYSLDLALGI